MLNRWSTFSSVEVFVEKIDNQREDIKQCLCDANRQKGLDYKTSSVPFIPGNTRGKITCIVEEKAGVEKRG